MNNKHLEPLGSGIKIYVSDSYRFSTDTILLADFSKQIGAKKCVDLGTGCGTIPLLWYKNNNRLDITAVEIQENACKLLSQSLEYNNLQDKIRIVNSDLNKLDGALPLGSFDLVACNPPYKISGGGITNPENAKLVARHESECTLDDVCRCGSSLLQFGKYSVEPKKLRLVQQRKSKAPKLFLLEGRRGGKRGFLEVMPTLFIEDESGNFSEEMLNIYGSYKEDYIN